MQNITIGEISVCLLFVVGFIGGTIQFIKYMKSGLKSLLKDEFEPLNKRIDVIEGNLKENTLQQEKNFLTRCFDDIEAGVTIGSVTRERIYECMEEYTALGGNSYLHKRFEELKDKGLL